MVLLMAFLEMLGVASVMPFMMVLANPQVVETNQYLSTAYIMFGFDNPDQFLVALGVAMLAIVVGSQAFKALTTYMLVRFTNYCQHTLSCRLVSGYLNQPYVWFLSSHTAKLGTSVLSEVGQVVNGALMPLLQLIAHSLVILVIVSLLVVVDPFLALMVALILGISYGGVYLLLRRFLAKIGAERVRRARERYHIVTEAFGGIKDVKISGLEPVVRRRFEIPSLRYARSNASSKIAAQLPRYAFESLAFGGLIVIALYMMTLRGGIEHALPVLSLYAFAGYRLMPALQSLYQEATQLRFSGPALDALHADFTGLRADREAPSGDATPHPIGLKRELVLRDVRYTYPGAAAPAVRDISICIPARHTVGLVGATGGGKTTLVDIILGLLQPDSGEVLVDGMVIGDRELPRWQRSIGYVPQSIFLTDDTIRANIAFGQDPATVDDEAVVNASRIANLHDFVSRELRQGYETVIGERGVRLSGGQRQRIGIARALYHDPDVLILDEATSALDNLTEKAVMDAVNAIGHRKTIIVIAHRLTTVRWCDSVFFLEQGVVTDSGTFDELVGRNQNFRAMAKSDENTG